MEIRCLRKRDTLTPQLRAMHWYSTWCTEEADLPGFEYLMAQHGTQAPLQEQQVPVHPDLYQLQVKLGGVKGCPVPACYKCISTTLWVTFCPLQSHQCLLVL